MTGKTLSFTPEQLESKNIKKTLTRTCLHYHSDKSVKAKSDGMSDAQIYLRAEIIKIITRFINEIKDIVKQKDESETESEEDKPNDENKNENENQGTGNAWFG